MALRVMQIFVPYSPNANPDELLEGRKVLGRWRDVETDRVVLHLLVPAEETEPIMDRFEHHYADIEGFHVVLFPVEAVLPRPEPELESPVAAIDQDNAAAARRISREELYTKVSESFGISRVFLGMTVLSSLVAAVGLMRDDVAVIIGAMVIAPLLGPNVAMSLGATLGDMGLLRRAVMANFTGILTTFGFAVLVGIVLLVDPSVPAIASRTELELDSLFLALAAGSAGTLAYTRGLSGAVIGVMVAVALVPPLVVFGMLVGDGHPAEAVGAMLVGAANIICINLAGVATFLVQGVQPRTWWEAEQAKRATRIALAICVGLLSALLVILWLTQM